MSQKIREKIYHMLKNINNIRVLAIQQEWCHK